jgi:hypothetical protein
MKNHLLRKWLAAGLFPSRIFWMDRESLGQTKIGTSTARIVEIVGNFTFPAWQVCNPASTISLIC